MYEYKLIDELDYSYNLLDEMYPYQNTKSWQDLYINKEIYNVKRTSMLLYYLLHHYKIHYAVFKKGKDGSIYEPSIYAGLCKVKVKQIETEIWFQYELHEYVKFEITIQASIPITEKDCKLVLLFKNDNKEECDRIGSPDLFRFIDVDSIDINNNKFIFRITEPYGTNGIYTI